MDESSLLGGAVAVRGGEGLRDHVRRQLDRLTERRLPSMGEELGEDIGGRLTEVARAAIAARLDGTYVPELHKWDYDLPRHFIDKDPETAIRIARAVLEAKPGDALLAVNLARIHRECGDPAAGVGVLAAFEGPVGNNRGF